MNGPWKSWYENGQVLDSGLLKKGIPDGKWMGWHRNGKPQFIRTYSADRWTRFQNEKTRYHPKRVSMPITKLYHDDKDRVVKYTTAINSFCAIKNCLVPGEELRQSIDNNSSQEHYHPVFENGLLHGVFVNYFPDGTLKDSGNYNSGLPDGLWIKWTANKEYYWKGYYHHGSKNNEWKLYSANDKLIRILFFKEGKNLWRKDIKEGVEIDE